MYKALKGAEVTERYLRLILRKWVKMKGKASFNGWSVSICWIAWLPTILRDSIKFVKMELFSLKLLITIGEDPINSITLRTRLNQHKSIQTIKKFLVLSNKFQTFNRSYYSCTIILCLKHYKMRFGAS